MGYTQNQKPKSIGSIYVNVKKGAGDDAIEAVAEAVQVLKEAEAFLSISFKKADGTYAKFAGFFNNYKEEGDKNPDIVVYASQMGEQKKPSKFSKPNRFAKSAKQEEAEEEQDEEEQEEAPAPKKKFVKKARANDGFDSDAVPF